MKDPDTRVSIAGIPLKNPVMTASGTCGYGLELSPFMDLSSLGALVVKGLSVEPRPGNQPPRIMETCGGMLNAIGLENVGMQAFIRDYLPQLQGFDTALIVNILGRTREEYAQLVETLSQQEKISALEVNVSCPNVSKGGIAFGADPQALGDLISFLKKRSSKPLIVKLTPNVTDIVAMAQCAENAGADALSLINTLRGMSVDIESLRPHLATITGGLSGPAIKPVALCMVWEAARSVQIPVIGIGGILTAEDALEFLICGATAVQVGTGMFRDPRICLEIITGLENYLQSNGMSSIREVIGTLKLP